MYASFVGKADISGYRPVQFDHLLKYPKQFFVVLFSLAPTKTVVNMEVSI